MRRIVGGPTNLGFAPDNIDYQRSRFHSEIRRPFGTISDLALRRYPCETNKDKNMTLALGILCRSGVVLGVDTEISVDGGKVGGPKIQVFWDALPNYNVVSASCGHADSVESAREEITEELEHFKGKNPAVREIRKAISDALARVYTQHIDPLPSIEERGFMDFTLLLAIRVGRSARLFRTNRAQVVEQPSRWCMGSGKEFADHLFGTLLGERPSHDLAAQLAVHVIAATKDNMDGVGHSTDVHVLQSDGEHWSFTAPQIEQTEKDFTEFFGSLRGVLETADASAMPEESISTMLGLMGEKVHRLRKSQKARQEWRNLLRH
jgi:20S proteasome alpha/beta subunit